MIFRPILRHAAFFCLFALFTATTHATSAPETRQESTLFADHLNAKEGCALAEQSLKQKAVAQQCGSQFTGGSLRTQSDSTDTLTRLNFETTGGRVVRYQLTNKTVVAEKIHGSALFKCTVQAQVQVQCDQGQRDPRFIPSPENQIKLNERVFRAGEAMKLDIVMPADLVGQVFVSVVQLLPYFEDEQRVWRLYPNDYQNIGPLTAKSVLSLPNNTYTLETSLPKGRNSVEEALMIIFARTPLSLPDTMTIEQLHRTLSELPLNERRETVLGYRIEASGKRKP